MNKENMLGGIVVSSPTPAKESYELDYQKFGKKWLGSQGLVKGKAVLMGAGGLGEGYFLTREEHGRIMSLVHEIGSDVKTSKDIPVTYRGSILRN